MKKAPPGKSTVGVHPTWAVRANTGKRAGVTDGQTQGARGARKALRSRVYWKTSPALGGRDGWARRGSQGLCSPRPAPPTPPFGRLCSHVLLNSGDRVATMPDVSVAMEGEVGKEHRGSVGQLVQLPQGADRLVQWALPIFPLARNDDHSTQTGPSRRAPRARSGSCGHRAAVPATTGRPVTAPLGNLARAWFDHGTNERPRLSTALTHPSTAHTGALLCLPAGPHGASGTC